jgi:release factor glutamine methyltransferase
LAALAGEHTLAGKLTLAKVLSGLALQLSGVSETPLLDAQVLAADLLGVRRAWILAHPEAELSAEQGQAFEASGHRLVQGEPLPYVLGHWEFYGLDFRVSPAVLIPRPETELLVGQALTWLWERHSLSAGGLAADVGCGSGCIAAALAQNFPTLRVIASDRSLPALDVAVQNIARHGLEGRVALVQADLLPALSAPLDLVCANLPYIPTGSLRATRPARWEPVQALDGGEDGLELIQRLLEQLSAAASPLAASGLALLEIEASQGEQALELARRFFPGAESAVLPDLSGRNRCLCLQT